jgi:hypothetical protein
MNLHVLAYNLKRVMKVLGVVPLMDATRHEGGDLLRRNIGSVSFRAKRHRTAILLRARAIPGSNSDKVTGEFETKLLGTSLLARELTESGILLLLHLRLDVGRRDRAGRVTQLAEFARPAMRPGAGPHRQSARRLSRKNLEQLRSHQPLAEHHAARRIRPVRLESRLRDVHTNRTSLAHGRLLKWLIDTATLALRCRRGRPKTVDRQACSYRTKLSFGVGPGHVRLFPGSVQRRQPMPKPVCHHEYCWGH